MKIGAEDKTKVKFMIGLVAAAVLIIGYNLLSGSPAHPANPGQTSGASTGQPKKAGESASSLDPTFRRDILQISQNVVYASSGRNIFRMEAASTPIPPVIGGGVRTQPAAPQPRDIPIPPLPDIPLRFYGFANRPGEPKRVFLSDNGEHFLAREGDIVERRYRIVQINNQINNPSVTVEDMLTNNRKSIPLTASPN
jgi:hypothetical protein